MVRHHHERWDGSGYPDRLQGEEIPRLARILAVADVFDAMRSARPHRSGQPTHEVTAYIRAHAGTLFDPNVVDAFERVMASGWVHDVEEVGLPRRSSPSLEIERQAAIA